MSNSLKTVFHPDNHSILGELLRKMTLRFHDFHIRAQYWLQRDISLTLVEAGGAEGQGAET